MASITDLDYTASDTLDDAAPSQLTLFRTIFQAFEDHINDKVADNLVQLSLDAYGSAYAFDNDGLAQYTANLYNKTNAVDSYTGGDVTIATTGAFTDVDTTNAAISITPELAGDFRVVFQFNIESVSSNATNETNVKFRLTDGSENSTAIPKFHRVTGATVTTDTMQITIEHTFESWSAALKTVKLQYYITTSTNTTIKVLADTSHPIVMHAEKV